MIQVNRNSYSDYRNAYQAAFPASLKYYSGPQLKCMFIISDSINQAKSSPSIQIIDLSLVNVVTLNSCFKMPLGQSMNRQSSPTRQFPLDLTVWEASTVPQKEYSRTPYSLSPTLLKEKPRNKKRQLRTAMMMVLMRSIFHLSFI